MMGLEGRVGIVTGPAKGMGAATTLALAEAGADLILAGRDTAAIEPLAAEISAKGRKVVVVACDVTDETDVAGLMPVVGERFDGRIDFLVNVAGGSGTLGKPIWENTRAEFEQIVTLNVTACFLTMRAVLPTMIAQRYGKVVNVGGTFGLRGRAGRAAYSTSKWALRGLTKSAALEAGPYNVNINCVCPGMVEGERFDRVRTDMGARLQISPDEARERMAAEYALRRISTAEDVANSVVFLASDLSRQITGQDLAVDGGWVI
jgi:NAD(P)-dependent dehydrogenase (short-subunit alcohol dehydrogenase family)